MKENKSLTLKMCQKNKNKKTLNARTIKKKLKRKKSLIILWTFEKETKIRTWGKLGKP